VPVVNGKLDQFFFRIESHDREGIHPALLGFLECFNQQEYFEAHKVLEPTWLAQRGRAKEGFYKGLIQLAGAFVHLQANRFAPAAALLALAQRNLASCPRNQDGLAVDAIRDQIGACLGQMPRQSGKSAP
jgi:predicted metal-dependent hydrolase